MIRARKHHGVCRIIMHEVSRLLAIFFLLSSVALAGDNSQEGSDAESERIALQMKSLSESLGKIPQVPRLDRTIQLPEIDEAEEMEPLLEEEIEALEEDLKIL